MTYDRNLSLIKNILVQNLAYHIQGLENMVSDNELSHAKFKTYLSDEKLTGFAKADLQEAKKLGYLEDLQSDDQFDLHLITDEEANEVIEYAVKSFKEMISSI